MSDYDRKSAMLTPAQRDYLRGESDIEKNSSHERAMRGRIRERLRNSILDLGLLQGTIEQRDLQKSFSDDWNPKQDDPSEVIHVFNKISPALSVIFGGTSLQCKFETVTEPGEEVNQDVLEMFADFVEGGLETMYVDRGVAVEEVNVEINVTLGEGLSDLVNQDLASLTEEELKQLLKGGHISIDEYTNAIKEIHDEDIEVIRMEPDTQGE